MIQTLLLALPLLAGLQAQAKTPPDEPPALWKTDAALELPRAALARATQGFGAARVDQRIGAFSPRTVAWFDAQGARITPVLGRRAPRELPLLVSLASIRRDPALDDRGELVVDRAAAPVLASDVRVVYPRGAGVIERWDAAADGVELSFELAALPEGDGDLVIALDLATELALPLGTHAARAHLVEPGVGGLFVDAPVAIDARGNRAAGALRFADRRLELVIPDAFVSCAALPLVVDPLFGASFGIAANPGDFDSFGEAAWDSGAGIWGVVWTRYAASGAVLPMIQRVSAAGVLIGGPSSIAVDPAAGSQEIAIGCVAASGRFLVAWHELKFVPPLSFVSHLYVRAWRASDGGISSAIDLGFGPSTNIAVSSELVAPHDRALVVFGQDQVVRAISVQVPPAGVPLAPLSTQIGGVTLGTGTVRDVDISQSGGANGNRLVAWTMSESLGGGTPDPWCRLIARDLSQPGSALKLSSAAVDEVHISVDGDGERWVAAWDFEYGPGDRDVHLARVVWNAGSLALVPSPVLHAQEGFNDEAWPEVAWCGDKVFLASQEQYQTSTTDYDVAVIGMDSTTLKVCEPEFFPAFTTGGERPTGFATSWSPITPSANRSLLLWDQVAAGFSDSDVLAALWDTYGPGIPPVDLGGGCGGGGTLATLAPPVIGKSDFGFAVTGIAPSATLAVVLIGPPQTPFACGPCSLMLTSWIQMSVPAIGGQASAPMTIPCVPLLTGAKVWVQAAVLPITAGPCGILDYVGASNRLELTLSN